MDHKMLAKTILFVWLYFTIRILFVTYWDALFLPPILIALDRLFQNSKSDNATQTEKDHVQGRKKDKEVNKEQDQNLTKEDDFQKITTPAKEKFTTNLKISSIKDTEKSKSTNAEADIYLVQPIAKIQELISDLQNSLEFESKNDPASSNSNKLTTKLENPSKESIHTTKISASSEGNINNSKTSPAMVKIQELIFDLQNSLK
ncbi:hypothetical protein TNCV_4701941 [Trichonephila clavipes]|uniref:Uncharacterized protein n=1 Tax=Trichonephila clavipes TaxID=2585209 RepID=A0A8X7BKP2_TRICX|nr:hypothetical protein TNCV_4701941 [Trichonephila clavipes]